MVPRPARWISFIAFLYNSPFPPLLSQEEERDCVVRMLAGSKADRDRLIEGNLRLVAHVGKKFESSGVDREDLMSIGTIGLIKGVSSYNPAKGARLATYAARCIENEILMYLRSTKNHKAEVSLYESMGADRDEVSLIDVMGSRDPTVQELVENEEERAALLSHFHVLNDQERYVLRKRYGLDGHPRLAQRHIAAHLGISRSYVSRLESKALAKLKAEFIKGEQ